MTTTYEHTATSMAGARVFRAGEPPGPDEVLMLETPAACVPPRTLKAVEIALAAAGQFLPAPGPPPLRVRWMEEHSRYRAEEYTDRRDGVAPATFPEVKGRHGVYWRDAPSEIWLSVHARVEDQVRAALHEATHAWRFRAGAKGMTEEEQEAEAEKWAEELLATALQVVVELAGTPSWRSR